MPLTDSFSADTSRNVRSTEVAVIEHNFILAQSLTLPDDWLSHALGRLSRADFAYVDTEATAEFY
jgi:hypothetical protein